MLYNVTLHYHDSYKLWLGWHTASQLTDMANKLTAGAWLLIETRKGW